MKKLLFTGLLLLATWGAKAQVGTLLDPNFGEDGFAITPISKRFDTTRNILELADGRILSIVTIRPAGSDPHIAVVCLKPDGQIDSSYGVEGVRKLKPFAGQNFALNAIELADKSVILSGYTFKPEGHLTAAFLIKLDANGEPISSFGNNGSVQVGGTAGMNFLARGVAELPDGKLIQAGYHNNKMMAIRYNSDDTLDSTYGDNGINVVDLGANRDSYGRAMLLQSDNKLLIVGRWTPPGELNTKILVVRLMPDGTMDTSFGPDGKGFITVSVGEGPDFGTCLDIQTDGYIVVGGHSWTNDDPIHYDAAIVKLSPDGKLDTSFDTDGIANFKIEPDCENTIFGLAVSDEMKIYATGNATRAGTIDIPPCVILFSLNPDGSFNKEFANEGKYSLLSGNNLTQSECLLMQKDGNMLIGGEIYNDYDSAPYVARLLQKNPTSLELPLQSLTANLTIYPNPAHNYIELAGSEWTDCSASIIDLQGKRIVGETKLRDNRLDISSLEPGKYILQVRNSEATVNKLFVKE